jgi:hypothetical protein
MFANQRSSRDGLWPLLAVAMVLSGWLISAGLMLKSYRDGGALELRNQCELVCRGAESPGAHG